MSRAVLLSPSAEARLERAAAWLASRGEPHVTVLGASADAAAEVARRALLASAPRRASFGWRRLTLGALAVEIARAELARRSLVPASPLALEAVSARVVHEHRGSLGRFEPIGELPGLPRALARTVTELRLAGVVADDPDLARLASAFEAGLERAGLADRARTFAVAVEVASQLDPASIGPLLLVDVPLRAAAERDLVMALASRAPGALATVPTGDARALALTREALSSASGAASAGSEASVEVAVEATPESTALARLQAGLFGEHTERAARELVDRREVTVLSAPGESRECVEIARLVLEEAERGTPFDRIAVLLRAPAYGPHLQEALRRAKVPAFFARGTKRPDPSGRALLALLACAAEDLSAKRFAEYLSLGELPDEDASGAPPPAARPGDRVATPDEEAMGALLGASAIRKVAEAADLGASEPDEVEPPPGEEEEDRETARGTLRAPRHWERLLVEGAVIGGLDRWTSRIDGLAAKLEMDLAAYEKDGATALANVARRDLDALASLRRFALPLVAELGALRGDKSWGEWLDAVSALATRALRHPDRVLAVLAELQPMAKVGPAPLREVRLVLERRLAELLTPPAGRRYGKVFVATIEEARGLSFDVVFVPGLAEKLFPQKVVEDPLLLDRERERLSEALETNHDRAARERLALRLAVGAATRRVVLSYPRLDVEHARPRTPSFYGLEVLRVAEGQLRGFEHLAETARAAANARIGWPAPARREDAIDEAEFDLALLEAIEGKPEEDCVGEARYLLEANDHLARALRFRASRWLRSWKSADGLVDPSPEALAAIRTYGLDQRSFSPTALQNYAACPYRFLLSAVHKLAPREEPAPLETLDPLTRGSLVHEVLFTLMTRLRGEGLLPVTDARLDEARARLDEVLAEVAQEEHDRLHPAIERVWQDALAGIGADLREWLRRMAADPRWTPAYFELSFGLKDRRAEDPHSTDEPAKLACGIDLRGSIDLVERDAAGHLRAVDYKTGKVRAKEGDVIKGGDILQPVMYALALEKLFPESVVVEGVLYYCTTAGEFKRVPVPLDGQAREAAQAVATAVGGAIEQGFLPAAPAKDACRYCDYRPVCGPYEEIRTKRKRGRLEPLRDLRRRP